MTWRLQTLNRWERIQDQRKRCGWSPLCVSQFCNTLCTAAQFDHQKVVMVPNAYQPGCSDIKSILSLTSTYISHNFLEFEVTIGRRVIVLERSHIFCKRNQLFHVLWKERIIVKDTGHFIRKYKKSIQKKHKIERFCEAVRTSLPLHASILNLSHISVLN